jgi:glycosyltransferase involved in cell wall biosynthesis
VLEAAQACCPLVLSDIPSFRELWEGVALFVSANDDRAFARAVEEIIGDPGLRARLGAAACKRARDYSVEGMAAGTLEVYGSLITPSHAGAGHERAIA